MRLALLTILLLAVAASVAACGGSGGGSSSATTSTAGAPLTKAGWIEQADAVCRKAKEGEDSARGPALLTKGRDLLREEQSGLEAIPVPPAETVSIDRLTRAVSSVVGLIDQERGSVDPHATGPSSQYELDAVLTAVGTPVRTMDEQFLAYGAKVCGQVTLGFPAG